MVYLTSKINTRVTDKDRDANRFDGNWYTASTLGFVCQILSMGMDQETDLSGQLLDLSADMALGSLKLLPEGVNADAGHPAARNACSRKQVFEKYCAAFEDRNPDHVRKLKESVDAAFSAGR